MRGTVSAAMAAALLVASGPAGASTLNEDLRCLVVTATIVGDGKGEGKENLVSGVLYFVGMIDGKAPGIDLKTEMQKVSAAMTQTDFARDAQRCGDVLVAKGQELQAIGQALEQGK